MKDKLILMLALMTSVMTYADGFSYKYLVITTKDGMEKSIAVDNLKLTFVNGQMVVHNVWESQTYDLLSLNIMFFSENAIDGIIETQIDANEEVDVYTVSGTEMGRYNNIDDAKQSLKRGVYIFKQGSKTNKISIK